MQNGSIFAPSVPMWTEGVFWCRPPAEQVIKGEKNHFIIREDTALVQTFDFARRKSRKLLSRVDKPGSDVVIPNPVKAVLIGRHIRQDIFIQRDIRLFLIAQRIFFR